MQLERFLARHPVFTREGYITFMNSQGTTNSNTQRELLAYHVKKGHVVKVRRGFYATVPRTFTDPHTMPVDGYLIAGRVASDAVLSYHTALDIHGMAYSTYYVFYFCSQHAVKSFKYQDNTFCRVPFSKSLIDTKQKMLATEKKERWGLDIYVSTLERTLVDILDRPELAGGWEEIWRSLEMVPVFDLDLILRYALALENATTIAKVGFFLETHQKEYSVTEKHLSQFERNIPSNKHYMDRRTTQRSKLIKRWNLMVPISILEKSWEEPNDPI